MLKTLFKETSGVRLVSVLTPLCMVGEVVMGGGGGRKHAI